MKQINNESSGIINLVRKYIKFIWKGKQMRFTNERLSPVKKIINATAKFQCKDYINYKLRCQKSYMHYNNAIYMGDMTSYKRNGTGIILTDDGTSAIVDYCYDTPTGHNVFFKENAIASTFIPKTGIEEIALRTGHYILKMPFMDQQKIFNGGGVLIDFLQSKVYHLLYQKGKIVKKILQTNKDIIHEVSQYNLKQLISSKHEEAFKLQLNYYNGIKIVKKGGKVNIGYFDRYSNLDGVGFKVNIDQDGFDRFQEELKLKCIERGLYCKNRLENYGERYFENGNLYIGQFEDDFFNGKGMLLYPTDINGKWVCGEFSNNKLIQMLDTSIGGSHPKQTVKSLLKGIHQLNSRNWMNVKIDLIDWQMLLANLEEAINFMVTDVVVQKEKQLREQQDRLNRIQNHFSKEYQSSEINNLLLEQKDANCMPPQRVIIEDYVLVKTKELKVEPRCFQNEQAWSAFKPSNQTKKEESKLLQKKFNRKLFSSLEKDDYSKSKSKTKPMIAMTPKHVSPFKGCNWDVRKRNCGAYDLEA